MKTDPTPAGCACCPMNRRRFLDTAGKVAIAGLGMMAMPLPAIQKDQRKLRIRIIYSLDAPQQARPTWPNVGFDFRPVMERINGRLEREFKDMDFVPTMCAAPEQTQAVMAEDSKSGNVDGYIVYQMNCWNKVIQTVAASGKPVLYADFQYAGSGGFLVYSSALQRANASNAGFLASSDPRDIISAVKCFRVLKDGGTVADFSRATAAARIKATPKARKYKVVPDDLECLSSKDCLARLKETRILAIRDQEGGRSSEVMGIKIDHLPFSELNEAWEKADKDESKAIADQWTRSARKVQDVSRETLETSAAMYLAQKQLMKRHGAQGITINCLGGFYGGHIHAYPCLGFHQLANDGLVGACECDVSSAATMLAGTILTQGRPGYISDPVIDTSKRQIIYAHCVAGNRAFGPKGIANPFEIMTHSEDRQGASVRSILPLKCMTTTLKLNQAKKEIIFHQGITLENDPDDRACRTKLCAEPVGDIEKLLTHWDQWGWHRVTFYGDLRRSIFDLADAAGWKVVEEA